MNLFMLDVFIDPKSRAQSSKSTMSRQPQGVWVSLRDLLNRKDEPAQLAAEIENGRLIVRSAIGVLRPATAGQRAVALNALEVHQDMLDTSRDDNSYKSREWHEYWRDWDEQPIAGLTDSGLYVDDGTRDSTASPAKHVSKAQRYEETIISKLTELGYDPKALPKDRSKTGPKAKAREALASNPRYRDTRYHNPNGVMTLSSFKHTWDDLLEDGSIKYEATP
jgi:hypothetical protein